VLNAWTCRLVPSTNFCGYVLCLHVCWLMSAAWHRRNRGRLRSHNPRVRVIMSRVFMEMSVYLFALVSAESRRRSRKRHRPRNLRVSVLSSLSLVADSGDTCLVAAIAAQMRGDLDVQLDEIEELDEVNKTDAGHNTAYCVQNGAESPTVPIRALKIFVFSGKRPVSAEWHQSCGWCLQNGATTFTPNAPPAVVGVWQSWGG
jgi:hypothetical protein